MKGDAWKGESCAAYLAGDYALSVKILQGEAARVTDPIHFCNRAAAHYELGLFRNVVKDVNEAISLDSKCLRAHLWKAKALFSLGKRADAILAVRAGLDATGGWGDVVLLQELKHIESQCEADKTVATDAKAPPSQQAQQTQQPHGGTGGNSSLQNKIDRVAEENLVQFGVGDKEVDKLIALGYFHTNSGNYTEAIVLFTRLLKTNPKVVACFLGRGTALAMSGRIKDAVIDFSQAVILDPTGVEGYRRRGQSLLAMNEHQLAMQDFDVCCRLNPEDGESHHQRGICFYKMRDFEKAKDAFELSTRLSPEARESWNHLGLTYNQLGRSREAAVAQEMALGLDPSHGETWSNLGQTFKELGDFEKAEEAFSKCLTVQPANVQAYWLRGLTRYLSGSHLHAMRDLRMALKLKSDLLEARNLLAVVLAARGRYRECAAECDALLKMSPEHPVWYTRRIAQITHENLATPLLEFSLDRLVEDVVKEGHCNRRSPRLACPSLFSAPLPALNNEVPQSPLENADRTLLAQLALRFGPKFQYNCPGFVVNQRQWLSAGVSIIQIAQMLSKGQLKGWRDMFEMASRWRQLSEPNDPVWWVDLLPQSQFCEGYGSHTPMITGQCATVRYSGQAPRAMEVVKEIILSSPLCPTRKEDVREAKTLAQLYSAMRRDFWVTTTCYSDLRPGKKLEGTRITLQCVAGHTPSVASSGVTTGFGFEFSIRTPGTPLRFREFSAELDLAWTALMSALVAFRARENEALDKLLHAALRLVFLWYNLMPLSRGSAALGAAALQGILLSAGLEQGGVVPTGFQPDWEAILSPHVRDFEHSMLSWLSPCPSSVLDSAPDVQAVLPTVADALVFLNIVGK